MPLPSFWNTGTASVANGDTTVTFSVPLGTADAPVIQAGDFFLDPAQPLVPQQRIASIDYDAGTAELAVNWPGTTMGAAPYEVRYVGDSVRSSAQTRRLLEQLSVVTANGRGLFFTFDDATADADPGAGKFRFNNATIASATAAYLDNLDANGAAISAILDTWDDAGSSSGRGQLWVRSIASPSTFAAFDVTGSVVDGTGYRKLTLAYIGGSGSLAASDAIMAAFVPMGAAGTDGTDGTGLFSRVRAVATSNITIATALNNGDTLDGVTLATNDLVLVAGQTTASQNGIYVVGASPARDSTFNNYDGQPGVYVSVMEGTAYADTLWRCTSDKGGTLGTDALAFSQYSSGLPTVATRTALKALNTTTITTAILTELSREGTFVWRAGDYSTLVAADTAEGIYVKATAVAASSGAWVRAFQGRIKAAWFGVVGDGSTDDASALNAAFTVAATTYIRGVDIPQSNVNYGSALTIPDYVDVGGCGVGSTVLTCTFATGNAISLGLNSAIHGLTLDHSATRTSGITIQMDDSAEVYDYAMQGHYQGIAAVGASAGTPIVNPRIYRGHFLLPATAAGGYSIFIDKYSSAFLDTILGSGATSGTQPDTGLKIGSGDTIIANAVHFLGFISPLFVNPDATETAFTASWSNCVFDTSNDATKAAVALTPGNANAHIKNWTFDNCWTGTSSGTGLWIEAFGSGATVDGVQWIGGRIFNLGVDGVSVGNGASNILIDANQIGNCVGTGVNVKGSATHVKVGRNRIGNIGGLGACAYGVKVQNTADYVDVVGNDLSGNGSAAKSITTSGTHLAIWGNIDDSGGPYGPAIADLAGATANRLYGSNGSGVSSLVTLPAAGLSLSAGALALANDLAAIEALSSTGIAVRTATDTWAQRSVAAGTGIAVTNGNGVSGNPTVAIDTAIVPQLAAANLFTAAQQVGVTGDFATAIKAVTTSNSATGGPILALSFVKSSQAVNDSIGAFGWYGSDSSVTNGTQFYGDLNVYATNVTHASLASKMAFRTVSAGSTITPLTIGPGMQLGSPTGGDKGLGSLNIADKLYVNGTQVLSGRLTGWTVATGTPSRATYATGSVSLATLAGVVMALEQDLITHGLIGT